MNAQQTGEFIKALRKESNLTQAELAEKLSCTDKAISRWETGKGLPDADMLLSLSAVFGVSINEILLGERFSFAKTYEDAVPEAIPDSRIIEEIISHTDEAIVDILKDKEQEVTSSNRSAIYVFALCCAEILLFLIPSRLPFDLSFDFEIGTAYFRFDPIYILLIGSLINYFIAGFIKGSYKWFFPVFVTLIWFFTDDYPGFMLAHGLAFGIPCLIVMCFVSGVRHLIKRRKKN